MCHSWYPCGSYSKVVWACMGFKWSIYTPLRVELRVYCASTSGQSCWPIAFSALLFVADCLTELVYGSYYETHCPFSVDVLIPVSSSPSCWPTATMILNFGCWSSLDPTFVIAVFRHIGWTLFLVNEWGIVYLIDIQYYFLIKLRNIF